MVDAVIRIFESTATTFVSNGIGYMPDALSCSIVEERNGSFELKMVYPITGKRYSELLLRRILVAKSNPFSEPQPFRIYEIGKPINGKVTVYAEHVRYDLGGIPVRPFTAVNAVAAMQALKQNALVSCPFTFTTDKSVATPFVVPIPLSIGTLLGGIEGSILDTYKGEYEFDRFAVKLWTNRGSNRGVTLRYAKNLTDLNQEERSSNLYTGVLPYWVSYEGDLVQGDIVNCPATYNFRKILSLDCSYDFEQAPTKAQLNEIARKYIEQNDIGVPEISLTVSFVNLSETPEYEDLMNLQEVNLCDTVTIQYLELGVNATAKCIKTTYNVLTGKYDSIELGDAKINLSESLVANNDKLIEDFKKQLISTTDTTSKEFEENLQKVYTDLVGDITGLGTDLDKKINDTANGLNGKIDSTKNDLNKTIDQTRQNLLGDMADMYDDVNEEILQIDRDLKQLITNTAKAEASKRDQAIAYATDKITGNLGGYVILHSSTNADYPDEILIMDTDKVTTAKKIWRWNKSGLGYSSKGYAGPYGLAITQDGVIVADYIQTGALNASLITTGVMNASLITAGYMSANRIFGGTLILGGANNGNGSFILRDASNGIIGSMNNSGVALYKGVIRGPAITIGGSSNASGILTVLDNTGATYGVWNYSGISIRNQGSIMFGGTYTSSGITYEGVCRFRGLEMQVSVDMGGSSYEPIYFQGCVSMAIYELGGGTSYVPAYGYWSRDNRICYGFISKNSDGTFNRRNTIILKNKDHGLASDRMEINAVITTPYDLTCAGVVRAFQLEVTGTKNRIVNTEHFGTVAMQAVESPEAVFEDFGSGEIGEIGEISIFFDPVFSETIEELSEYQVFLTRTSPGELDYVQKEPGFFTVYGRAGTSFDWSVVCKQRDYSSLRMETRDPFPIVEAENSGTTETMSSDEIEPIDFENIQNEEVYSTNVYDEDYQLDVAQNIFG